MYEKYTQFRGGGRNTHRFTRLKYLALGMALCLILTTVIPSEAATTVSDNLKEHVIEQLAKIVYDDDVAEYDSTKTYSAGAVCIKDGSLQEYDGMKWNRTSVFQFAADGKKKLAAVLTKYGATTSATAPFSTIAANVEKLLKEAADGKSKIATAINQAGVTVKETDTYDKLAGSIGDIKDNAYSDGFNSMLSSLSKIGATRVASLDVYENKELPLTFNTFSTAIYQITGDLSFSTCPYRHNITSGMDIYGNLSDGITGKRAYQLYDFAPYTMPSVVLSGKVVDKTLGKDLIVFEDKTITTSSTSETYEKQITQRKAYASSTSGYPACPDMPSSYPAPSASSTTSSTGNVKYTDIYGDGVYYYSKRTTDTFYSIVSYEVVSCTKCTWTEQEAGMPGPNGRPIGGKTYYYSGWEIVYDVVEKRTTYITYDCEPLTTAAQYVYTTDSYVRPNSEYLRIFDIASRQIYNTTADNPYNMEYVPGYPITQANYQNTFVFVPSKEVHYFIYNIP